MSLLNLPLDLLYEIASRLYDHDLNTLIRTCSPLHVVFNFELYRRDAKPEQCRALFWSVMHNRDNTLRKSLQAGARAPWATLLWLAVENDAVLAMKVLVEQDGVDINMVEQFEGIPLLGKAVVERSAKIVRFLLTREDLDPNIKDAGGRTPLAYAAHDCFNDIVKILLKSPRADVNCTDNGGFTPLHLAARKSNVYVVRTLLADPAVDVTVRDNVDHRTALLAAVESLRRELAWRPDKVKLKHRRTIQALLEHPATAVDYDTDPDLLVMYRLSAQYGYEEIFKWLWTKGVGQLPGELDNSGILFFVAKHGQGDIMKWLFANGFEPDAQTKKGRTVLSVAAEHKQIGIIRLLLATGKVDVNSKDQDGRTPLWWAMTHEWRNTGTDETLKLLIERGAAIPTIQGKKAVLKTLYKALEYGNCFLSEMLFDQLDKLKPINGMNRRLLLSAVAKSGDTSLAKTVLERAKINLNARNSHGQTILEKAIFSTDLALVDLLLVIDGIHLNSRDQNGDTALAIALKELNCYSGAQHRQFFETCVEKLLRHKDVTTASLDLHWLIDYIVSYLGEGGDQKLMKLLILKDDRLVSETGVREDDADTLLQWAQVNQYRTIVRALKEKGRRMRTTAAAATTATATDATATTNAATTEAATTATATTATATTATATTATATIEAGRHTYTWTYTMERLQRGVETLVEVFLAPR